MAGAVKGTAITSVVEDVIRIVDEGLLAREQLELRLERDDLELLEQKLLPSSWYSLESHGRLTQLLLECEGRGSLEYLIERGRRAAERLRTAGLYAQLTMDPERWGERVGKMMMPLGPSIYRDTTWRIRQEGTGAQVRFEIEVEVPPSFPDVCRHPTQGFIEHAATHASGRPVQVTSERVSPSRMVFRGQAK